MARTQIKGNQIDPIDISSGSGELTGILPVANGGTGLSAPGTSGNVLQSNGSAWISATPSGGGNMNTTTYDPAAIAQQVVGTTATQTLTNKTLTGARFNQLHDTLGNPEIVFTATPSSVNYLSLVNGATGSSVQLVATGTDANIPLELDAKGAAVVRATSGFVTPAVALTSGATVNTDASLSNSFTLIAGISFTLANPTNPTDGQRVTWRITQDATGSRLMTLGSAFRFGTSIVAADAVLTTTGGKTDYIGAIYNSASSTWDIVAVSKGY